MSTGNVKENVVRDLSIRLIRSFLLACVYPVWVCQGFVAEFRKEVKK